MAQAFEQFGPLNALAHIQQQGELGRERGRQNQLAQLAGQAYSASTPQDQQQLLTSMAVIDPASAQAQQKQFQYDEDRQRKLVYNAASYMKTALDGGNPAAVAGAWQAVRPSLIRAGIGTEQDYAQDWQQEYEPLLHQVLAAGSGGVAPSSQNKVVGGALVTPDGQVVYEAPVDGKLVEIADGMGGKMQMVYNSRTNSLSPLPQAGAAPSASAGGMYAMPDGQRYRLGADLDPAQIAAAQADMQAGGTLENVQLPDRNVGGSRPGYIPPKPDISPYQRETLNLQERRLQAAEDARNQAAAARKDAAEAKDAAKRQASDARQIEAATAANQLVSAIDSLTQSSGFAGLGTAWGDLQQMTPLVRNDVKDANAQLKNIAGQVALTTMARLKALSSQGATGFGALSAPELRLLENSIATLQSDNISNAQLTQSLNTIRDAMIKTSTWAPQPGPQPGQEEDGYRFRGGDASDPNNWERL